MADMRLIVTGAAGRMGRMLIKGISETPGLTLSGALERPGAPTLGEDAGAVAGLPTRLGVAISDDPLPLLLEADGIIDFSAPPRASRWRASPRRRASRMSIGTTGLSEADLQKIAAAARHAPIVRSGNMSLGVNLLESLVRAAARALGEEFDIEVVEMHHRMKVDAPSGTALMLGEAAAEGRGVELAGHSARGRDGHHRRPPQGRHRVRVAARRDGRGRPQRDLRGQWRTHHALPSRRRPQPVRPRRPEGRALGARPQAGALCDGGRIGDERRLRAPNCATAELGP